jgi:hypothetical protein
VAIQQMQPEKAAEHTQGIVGALLDLLSFAAVFVPGIILTVKIPWLQRLNDRSPVLWETLVFGIPLIMAGIILAVVHELREAKRKPPFAINPPLGHYQQGVGTLAHAPERSSSLLNRARDRLRTRAARKAATVRKRRLVHLAKQPASSVAIWSKGAGQGRPEFPPPIIEAYSETNLRILKRIAVAMLERPGDEIDVMVGDAEALPFSLFLGQLAFNPVSGRAQEYLEGFEGTWWEGELVLEDSKDDTLVEELERRGYKLGVRLGSPPNRSERWLQRIRNLVAEREEPAGTIIAFFLAVTPAFFLLQQKFGFGENTAFLAALLAGVPVAYGARCLARVLRRVMDSRIAKIHAARWECWKRTVRAAWA